jgi:hypothetical protein
MAKTDPTESFEVVHHVHAAPDGIFIGDAVTDKVGFFGFTPIVQRANGSQAAAGVTGATSTTPWGFTTSTQANASIVLLNEMRAALIAYGLLKGSA